MSEGLYKEGLDKGVPHTHLRSTTSNTLQAKALLTKGGASENKQANAKRNKDERTKTKTKIEIERDKCTHTQREREVYCRGGNGNQRISRTTNIKATRGARNLCMNNGSRQSARQTEEQLLFE